MDLLNVVSIHSSRHSKKPPQYNRDICSTRQILEEYKEFAQAIEAKEACTEFEMQERIAKSQKLLFRQLGFGNLLSISILLLGFIVRFVLKAINQPFPSVLEILTAFAGFFSVLLTILMAVLRPKQKWLRARFVAERVRQWKFQQFVREFTDGSIKGDASGFDGFVETVKGYQAITGFMDGDGSVPSSERRSKPSGIGNAKILLHGLLGEQALATRADDQKLEKAREYYLQYRLNWQIRHFDAKREESNSLNSWTDAAAKFSLILAAVLALVDIGITCSQFCGRPVAPNIPWIIGGLSIAAAVLSGIVRALRQGLTLEDEQARYQMKANVLKRLRAEFDTTSSIARQCDIMIETENILEDELREFFLTNQRADFLF